jgi:E3 ubiquitin-protein ligase RNF13
LYLTWRVHQQRQQQREHHRIASYQTKAPAELVYKLKSKIFHKENKNDEEEECIICLETYQEGDILRKLPCNHEFHSLCVDTWLITRKKYVS